MSKITKIEVKGFKKHKHIIFDVSSNINTLFGTSNSGKSAIIQAINWCLRNKYDGKADSYRTFNKKTKKYIKETSVKIWFDDNNIVERVKTSSVNAYYLNDNERSNPITSFNRDVPDNIAKIINMNDINYENQDDNKFLISENSTEKAKILNKIVNMEKIEVGVRHINKKQKTTKTEIDALELVLSDRELEHSKLQPYIRLSDDLVVIEGIYTQIEQSTSKLSEISNLLDSVKTYNNIIKKYDVIDSLDGSFKIFDDLHESYIKSVNRYKELSSIISDIDSVNTIINNTVDIDNELKEFDVLYKEYTIVSSDYEVLNDLIVNYKTYNDNCKKYDKQLENIMLEIKEWEKNNKICPTCKQIINK